MRSLIARRKHVDLTQAVAAFYDPNMPTRDAVVLWRKAVRRADKETKKLLLSRSGNLRKGTRRRIVKRHDALISASILPSKKFGFGQLAPE
jgi:hypothetical protein